ncbi:uncharacterized protein FFNC_10439 [Fusarium fujikuroi]|nr:uncharacterized protein FFNC_10439 [Fusarium fujikuroi]
MAQPVFEFPYGAQGGRELCLEEGFHGTFASQKAFVDITFENNIPSTKSHVMHVTFMKTAKVKQHGVLKLYDRRYPGRIRQANGTAAATAPSVAEDAAYRTLVRQGKMDVFPLALKHIYKTDPKTCASDFLHNHRFGGAEFDSMARFEAATWYECDQHFKTELKAYKKLERLQGSRIPRLYAHVRIPHGDVPQAARDDAPWDRFLCVHGLLLEHIPGLQLEYWPTPDIASNITSGVLLKKTCKNVIVKEYNPRISLPFIVDFTEAVFKEDLDELEIKKLPISRMLFAHVQILQPGLEQAYWDKAKESRYLDLFAESFGMILTQKGIDQIRVKIRNYQAIPEEFSQWLKDESGGVRPSYLT